MIIGILGPIGAGKTSSGKIFEKNGAYFINADEVVEKLYEKKALGARKIENFFGPEFLLSNGNVNRSKLRKVVFNNEKKLVILNKIIHPLVTYEIQKIIDKHKKQHMVIEAIDFNEKFLGKFIDKLLMITCHEEIIKERLKKKKKIPVQEAMEIFKKQNFQTPGIITIKEKNKKK